MNALEKFQLSLMDNICECLISESSLKKDLNSTVNVKISSDDLKRIREETLTRFRQATIEQMNEAFQKQNLSSLLDKLKAMSKASKGKIGWRPLGDAQSDSYGTRRGRLVEHKNRLEALKAELEKEIEGIRAQHQLSDSC